MPTPNNVRYAVTAGGQTSVWGPQTFEKHKDQLFADYPDATVVREDQQWDDGAELDGNTRFQIDTKDGSVMWGPQTFAKHRDQLLKDYPDAKISRMSMYDYGADVADRRIRLQAEMDAADLDMNKAVANGVTGDGLKRFSDRKAQLEQSLADLGTRGEAYDTARRERFENAVKSGEVQYETPEWGGLQEGETEEQHRDRTGKILEEVQEKAPKEHDWAAEAASLGLSGEALVEEMTKRRRNAEKEQKAYEKELAEAEFEYNSNPLVQRDKRIEEGQAEMQKYAEEMQAKRDALSVPAYTPPGAIMNTRDAALMADKDYVRTQVAYTNALDRVHKEEMIRDHTVNSFWANAGNALLNPESWTFGLGKLYEAGVIMDAVKDQGSESAQETLKQAYLLSMADADYADQQGNKGRWGQMTGEMAQFIILNALGGSLFKGAGEAVAKKIAGEAAEGAATSISRKFLGKRILGAAAKEATMALLTENTVGAANTIAAILDRHNGHLVQNEDGTYDFADGEGWWKSIWNTEAEQFTEYFTERVGEHFGTISKLAAKTRPGQRLGLQKVLSFIDREPVSGFEKGVRNFFSLAGVQHYPGEVLEEELGIVMSNMLQWRTPGENLAGVWEGLTDGQQQADIFGGMAFSIGLMQSVPLAAHVGVKSYNAIHGERLNANLNKAETQAANAFNNKEEWNTLKDRIDTAANEDITPIIYEIASNDSMLPEEKKAALQYVDGLMRLRGFSTGVMSEMRQAVMTRRNAEARDLLGTYGQFWTEEEIDTGVKRERAEGLEGTGLVMTDEKGRAKTEKGTTQRLQYARRITFSDDAGTGFGEAFVMSQDDKGVLVKANDGKLYVIQNDSLDQMVQNGQAKDSGRVPLFMVLDQRAADMEKVREAQRMREEARNNANNLLAAAAPGTQVNIGTEGNENKATVLGYQNGQFIVQDADGQQRNVSPKDMAGYLGMAYDAKTDAEINEINGRADEKTRLLESHQGKTFTYKGRKYVLDGAAFSADANGNLQCTLIVNGDGSTITLAEYEADDILSQLDGDKADQYNGSIRQGQKVRVDLGGTEAEYAFKEAVVEDGEVIIKAIDPESGAVVDLAPEMVTNMDELMGGTERHEDVDGNPVPAPSVISEESTQPTDFFDDPVANELGIGQEYVHVTPKGTRVLDRAKLWRDNPELWARWYDRQEGRTKSTRDYLEDKLKEADKDVADALNAYAAEDQGEQNPDRLEALMDDVNEKTRRQQQIKALFDKYDAAEKSAAKTAENAQNAAPAQGQNPAPAAMTPQAAATPAATPRKAEQTASEAQKALSELSKRQATTKEQGERQAIMEAKAIVLQQMLDELGAKDTKVVTRANVVEEYRKAGGTEEECANLEQKLAETKQARARMRGFYSHGRVFIIADDIVSAADANIAQLHEAKHLENSRTGAVGTSLATGVTTAEMKTAIQTLTGSQFYEEESRRSLADEVFANAEEIAEKEGEDAVPQRLRDAGIKNEEFINFVTNNIKDGRRRNGERRHLGRRDALQSGNTEVRRQEDGRDTQPQSGAVEGQVVRPDEGGRQGAGGREAEPAAESGATPAVEETLAKDSEAAVTEEITANLGGHIEGENGDVPVQFSITAGAAGVGLKANESDAKGNVTFEFSDGRVFDADHPLTVEDVKNEPNTVMGYMMNHARELGTITQEQADTIWQKYTDTLNRMLEKGSAENGGVDALSSAWQWVGETVFKTVATNSDAQYKFSLDITRVCKKNEAVINTISEVQRRLGYGITPGQVMDIYMSGIEEGYQVPCPVCYVFSRYISNGIYATIAINGQRKYGRMLVDPRTLTEEQKAERVKWWLAEKERLEAIDEKHKKQIAMAKDEVARIFKRIDQIGKQIGTMDAKAQAEARKEIKALDRRYRTALNAISQSNMAQWIKQFAIRETKDGWELYGDTFQGFPDEYALDLRLTAETIEKYPGIQRLRKSGGSAAGKEIHFAANNDIGDVTMMLGASDLKNAPNYYQEAVKATDPKEKEVLLDMAKKQFAKAVIYAAQQSLRGGQRMWSWSDNIERLAPDVFFNLIQMQMLGGALQSYSKQLEGVDLVASMGGYVNGSLMGYGNGYAELTEADIEEVNGRKVLKEDITDTVTEKTRKGDVQRKRVLAQKGSPVFEVDGKNYVLVFDDVVGIDAHGRDGKQGLFALNARLDKAGNILVGMNDIHVRTAMADDRVFFIIPWHASGMAGHILRQMLDYLKVDTSKFKPQDYTDVQEEKDVGTEKKPITPQLASFWEKHKNETDYKCGIEGGIPSGENGLLSAQQKEYRSLRDAIFVGVKEDTGRTNKNGEAIYKTVPVTEKPEMMAKINGDEFLSQVFRKVRDRVSTGMMTAGDTKYIYPYEYWDEASTYGTADVNGARYLEYCRRLGVKPKFVGKLGYKAGEDFGNFADDKGYWKLLIDRRMYKTDGTFQDLDPVDAKGYTPDLIDPIKTGEKYNVTKVADDEGVKRMADRTIEMEKARMGEIPTVDYDKDLDEAVAEYLEATLTDAQRKALNLVNGEQKPKKPKKSKKKAKAEVETQADSGLNFSITAEQDAEYMQAVESGDMERAQEMVRDAFKAAFPNTKVVDEDGKPAKVYHGSTWNPMEEKIGDAVFKDSYRGTASGDNGFFGRGFYFTYGSGDLSRAEAGYYGPTITEAFLDIQNPFMFNETLYEYNGKRNAGSEKDSVVILNMVKNFPALCDNLSLEIYNGEGENEGIISLEDYAKLFEDIYNNKEFIVNETDERGIVEVLADPVTHKKTLPNGREVEWTDYGFRMQMYRPGKNEDARLAYTHYYLTDMQDIGRDDHRETIISVPSSLFSELFESEEFTEALKQRGYDGVMQSANGDEVVAFAPSQIKSADPVTYDDNGDVIPLSERFNPANDDIRFSVQSDEETERLFAAAKERFGTTRDIREAGYVLPDGTMLDFSGRHWTDPGKDNSWLNGMRQVDHRDIADLEYERDGNTPTGIETSMSDFIRRGAIRINDGSGASINLAVKPTQEQASVLTRLIEHNNGDVYLDLGDGERTNSSTYYDKAKARRVINDIKRYFDEGIEPEGNLNFSIRGVLGAQNDAVATANLDTAKDMEKAGKDAKTIWLATGWEKGKDGKWRSEIPDGKAKAFPVGKRSLTVADLIDAPELFEAYPEIKDYKVSLKKISGAGAFIPTKKEIELDADYNAPITIPEDRKAEAKEYFSSRFWGNPGKAETFRREMEKKFGERQLDAEGMNTVMHELQHAIQSIEGFARGGSEKGQAQDYLSKAYKTRPEAVTFARAFSSKNSPARLLRFGRTRLVDYITKNAGSITEGEGEATRRLEALRDYINGLDDWGYRNLVGEGARLWSNAQQIGKSEYPRLAGETEARNVEKRRSMSEEERRNTPLSETEDVAREEQVLRFSIREGEPPKKTGIGYKVFYQKDGKLYPPMVANPGGVDTPVGVWLDADAAPIAETSKTGRPKVKQGGKGTQGGSGTLAFRPGWHLGEIPYALQFNRVNPETGKKELFPKDFVWAEVEYSMDNDYQQEAEAEGMTESGKFRHSYAGLKRIPKDGFYRYRTNPNPETDPWIITGAMKVNRILTNEEVDDLVRAAGREPQRREDESPRFSVTAEQDKEYMDAVNAGDMAKAQRMVRDAFEAAFPNTKVVDDEDNPKVVYHGTDVYQTEGHKPFYIFYENSHFGTWKQAEDRLYNRLIAPIDGRIYEVYLNLQNPKRVEDMPNEWGTNGDDYWNAAIEQAKSEGYDGIIYENRFEGAGEDSYIAFSPSQIKSALPVERDDEGNVIPLSERFNPQNEDIRFSVSNRNQEVFVSNAERAVEGIRMEKATPEQWLKMIEKGGGLKAGEDKWIGLSDWLKAQDRKSLTKQEVLDYIDQNKIRIEEVNYSDLDNGIALENLQEEFETIPFDDPEYMWDEADRRLSEFYSEMQEKYGDEFEYEMSPSERTAESQLIEEREKWDAENVRDNNEAAFNAMVDKYGDDFELAFGQSGGQLYVRDGEAAEYFLGVRKSDETRLEYTTEGLDNKREIALTVPTIEPWNQGDNIHFGDAGEGRAIAWARFGETKDGNGDRVLVIDEIQSKRHQEGREQGYATPMSADEVKQREADYDAVAEEMKAKYGSGVMGQAEYWDEVSAEDKARILEVRERYQETEKAKRGVRPAPFEKNWHELAMKRMLRLAAEEGYDYVAWTTGEQQAERYALSKVITGVQTARYPNEPDVRYVYLVQDGAPDIELHVNEEGVVTSVGSRYFSEYEGKKLSDIIGKELAVKTMATETDKYGNAEVVAEGEDLRIGGEGMKGFYDEMLPRFMNKYGKKWGVKVEDITLPGLEPSARTMHAVPVTQEMKDSVMEGQLMFSVQGQKDRMETIDRVAQDGLASVIGEDEVSNLYKDVYAAIPKDVLKPVVEQALGRDLDIRRAVKGYLHDLAAKGTENDETGLLFALYNEIRFLTGNADLTDNDARYLLWKETSDAKEGDILALAEDRAMRNRWKVGESDLRFSAQGEFEEATGKAKEKADKRMDDAEEEYKKAKEETKQEQDETGRLWGQANDIRKAMEAQKTYDKATVDSIVRFAKEILKNGRVSALTLREASRLLTLVTNATGKSPKFASRYAEQLMDMLLDHIVGDEKAKFMKLVNVKDSTTSQSGVNKQGKLDVLGQITMKAFRDNMNSSLDEIQRRKEELSDRINHKDKAVRDEAFAEYRGLRLAEVYAENVAENLEEAKDLEKDLKDGPEETTRKARDEFKKVMGDAIRRNKMERVDMYRDLAARLADIINGSAEKAAEFREAERQRVEDIHHDANRDMKGVPTTEHRKDTRMQRFLNSDLARFFCKPLATADQMFRMIGRKAVDGMGFLYNRFIRQWDEAAGKKSRGIFQAMSELDAKASEVFGKKMRWSDLYKEERGLPQMEVDFMDGGEMKSHTLTQGNMLYIYMADKMIDGKMKLRKMGIMEEDVAAIKERLDPRFIELADWLQSEYLVEKRNKYNAVHERMFGAPMAAIENYFPIKILSNARIEEVDLGNKPDGTTLSSTTTGSILKRRKNSLALDILHTDAFSLVVEHIEQMEDWAAFAELRRDMNTLLSYKRFRNQVQNMNTIYGSGKALWDNFKDVCSILVGSYKPKVGKGDTDTLALNAAKGVTAAKISFRVNTAIKQLLSFPAYLPDARPDLLAKSLATPGKSWKWCMENLPLFEKRWKSRIAGDTRLMDTESDWKLWRNNVVKTAARLGMTPNAFVDATTVAIGAKAMYDTKFARYKKEGYSDEEADKKAKQDAEILYNQTQQSSEDAFVSAMQLDRTWISVMLTTYRNSSMSYQRQLHDALRTMAKMLKPGYRSESIRFMTNQRMNEGLEEEEARAAAESQYNRQWLRSLARVAVFGYGLQLLWKIGNDMWYMLLGDDDDEKKKIFREAALSELAAPVEGLSAGNVMSDAWSAKMKEKVNEEYGIKTNNRFAKTGLGELPIISDINTMRSKFGYDKPAAISDLIDIVAQSGFGVNPRTFSDTIVAIIDACDGNLDTAKEAGLLMMRIMQVPQSTIEKFIIDEIDMTAADARKLSADELAKRYAEYKVLKNAPYSQWLYDEGTKAKRLKAAEKSFKEKVGNRMKEKAEAAPLTIDETYKDFEKGMKDYQKRLNLAKKDNDIATRDALMAQPEYREYQTWKKYQKAINRLDKSIKNTVDEGLRKEWMRRREELIQNMINEIESE